MKHRQENAIFNEKNLDTTRKISYFSHLLTV